MVIDIILVIVTLTGFYLGFNRGIIKTVFTVLSLTLGMVAAFKFAPITTDLLSNLLSTSNPLMFIAGFLLSFVVTMILIRTLANGLEGILKTANINFINQLLGGAVTAGFLIMAFSVLLQFGEKAHLVDKQSMAESKTYGYLKQYPPYVYDLAGKLWPVAEEFWHQSLDMMDKLENMGVEKSESEPNVFDIPDEGEDTSSY